jgi:hypothetical protein
MNNLKKTHKNLILLILFSSFFIIGLVTFRDYAVHIEEKFHRTNGFFWLNYLLNFTNFEDIKNISFIKFQEIGDYTLSSVRHYNKYGIIFDLPAAFIEIILNLEESRDFYRLRHFLSFLFFFLSSIFFYKILNNRFKNFNLSIVGTIFYVLSPRIYGDSFLYKDVLFLSLLTFSIYSVFLCFDKLNYKNLTILALLSAFCISTRIIGIFIPVSFSLMLLLTLITQKQKKEILTKCFFYLSFCLFFLLIHWPYLWESPVNNFLLLFKSLKHDLIDVKILFNNEFINNRILPYKYIPYWIFLTTPILNLFFFIYGLFLGFKRIFFRFISINKNTKHPDFWRGKKEKKDFFIFFNIFSILLFLITFNVGLYNGWRIIYFLNIFIIYYAAFGFYIMLMILKKRNHRLVLNLSVLTLSLFLILRMNIYHPYQSVYFNFLVPDKIKNSFEIDYYGLGGVKFLNRIIAIEPNKKLIKIGVASHTPLQRSVEFLTQSEKDKFEIVGQEYHKADYIFKNNISEVNSRHNDKYDVPYNFVKIEEYIVDGILIYELFKFSENQ